MEAEDELPPLSERLDAWLVGPHRKTVGDLIERFGPQSFAVLFVVLMAVPALPIPTGGITHVLEVIAMLLALELMVGRREVWVPARLCHRDLTALSRPRFVAALLKRVRWFEKFARPRGSRLLQLRVINALYGVIVFVLALTAFLAPPFSGLDTLPALGAVVLSLGFLFGDGVIVAAGLGIGALGIAVVVGLGHLIRQLL
jgi:hypothetical protein